MRLIWLVLLLLPAPTAQEAERVFRQMQRTLDEARTFRCAFEGRVTDNEDGGVRMESKCSLTIAKGNRYRIEVRSGLGDDTKLLVIVSDGSKEIWFAEGRQLLSEDAKPDFGRQVHTAFLLMGLEVCRARETDRADQAPGGAEGLSLRLSDFELKGDERVGGRDARVVAYRIAVTEGDTLHGTVWIDARTHLPLKWRLRRTAIDWTITHTVTEQAIDGEIGPTIFVPPAGK